LDRPPQMLTAPVRYRVSQSHVLCSALHNGQHSASVTRRLQQPVEDTGRPKNNVQHWIRVQKQHLLDLTIDIASLVDPRRTASGGDLGGLLHLGGLDDLGLQREGRRHRKGPGGRGSCIC
jgi:hypothetical protein